MTRNNGTAKSSIGTASKEARGAELYETPYNAVYGLQEMYPDFFGTPRRLWDPACGPGTLIQPLEARGHDVFGSDLHSYEHRWRAARSTERIWGRDFFSWTPSEAAGLGAEAIVMNPPFSLSDAFLVHALSLVPRVFVLLELRWQSGVAPVRRMLLDGGYIIAAHPFDRRLDMHRDGYDGKRGRQTRLHAWYFAVSPPGPAGAGYLTRRINLPAERVSNVGL